MVLPAAYVKTPTRCIQCLCHRGNDVRRVALALRRVAKGPRELIRNVQLAVIRADSIDGS